ncbi:ubiquinone/menaquinone biosynthesis methyltransferase [Actinoallomurus spadix]|uniref:Demethylmenaquinone methyltransferase n=1 Tax=Actinoallomurus spadix TaxID=79912 RepID=A0ABN0X3B9_9ACTN|nr:ubiquinone/menaquinone biosynthesis methyltransferase [Actinoallomurus spadix]MCO5986024.1 ubiquinone/menaquinone biosynthesis methyltransferase [Actinoallomurus spadix]
MSKLDKNTRQISAMFDKVSTGYDRTRAVIWLGQAPRWTRIATATLGLKPADLVLDVAAGTGTSARALCQSGARAVGCDISTGMLAIGQRRAPTARFVAGDALRLPIATGTFDAVSIFFGLRNVNDVPQALREMWRVTKPGGRLMVCEYAPPTDTPFGHLHAAYLRRVMPNLARLVGTSPSAYRYLAQSIMSWPTQAELADIIGAAGWRSTSWLNLTGGFVAVHQATKAD